jgi:hypothetical protein
MTTDTRWLKAAAAFYGFGLLVHTLDHLRRGLDVITPQVSWAGNLSTLLGIVAIVLVFTDHRYAAPFAAFTGLSVGIGVAAVHLLPEWSVFSDAFPGARETGVTGISWAVVLIEVTGALAMGVIASRMLWMRAAHR